jgi:hypothetical protein
MNNDREITAHESLLSGEENMMPDVAAQPNRVESPESDSNESSIAVVRPTESELQLTADIDEDVPPDLHGPSNEPRLTQDLPPVDSALADGAATSPAVEGVRGTLISANQELRRMEEYCHASLQLSNPLEAMEGFQFGVLQKITSMVGTAVAAKLESSDDKLATMSELKPHLEQYLRLSHEGEKLANLMMRLAQPRPQK